MSAAEGKQRDNFIVLDIMPKQDQLQLKVHVNKIQNFRWKTVSDCGEHKTHGPVTFAAQQNHNNGILLHWWLMTVVRYQVAELFRAVWTNKSMEGQTLRKKLLTGLRIQAFP